MLNDHSASVEFSSYQAYRLLILMNFMDFQSVFPCVFLFRCMIIKLILKSHYTCNPHFKFIYQHEKYVVFLFRFKSPHFCSKLLVLESSTSVGGSVLLAFLFSPVVSVGFFRKQNLSDQQRSLKSLDSFSDNYSEIIPVICISLVILLGSLIGQKFNQFFLSC